MEKLPTELILQIALFLNPPETVPLQLASKHFYKLIRDNGLWKEFCLKGSHSQAARRRSDFLSNAPIPIQEPRVFELQRAVARSASSSGNVEAPTRHIVVRNGPATSRAMACWDPTYPGERVNWYDEYMARHAPLSISWLQQPCNDTNPSSEEPLETRGLGLFERDSRNIVVAPLEDGSVCLWDIGEEDAAPRQKDGRILAQSRPGLLSVNGPNGTSWQDSGKSRAKMTSTGVVECVSVDRIRNKAYFAVQSGLNEVDLNTLQISNYDRYPFSIAALSEASNPVPLTVGTTRSLHMHDPRIGNSGRAASCSYFTDSVENVNQSNQPPPHQRNNSSRLDSIDLNNYATLFQPLPLSILHLNPSSTLYVAGRFPSILQYDRRFFPKLASTIHSGGSLCSITSLPSPTAPTLAAAGEYNGKGSLELYPLAPSSKKSDLLGNPLAPVVADTAAQSRNRTSASSSKLLSLTPHGTRLLFSDSGGQVKWVERDGCTHVRRWNINSPSFTSDTSPFNSVSQISLLRVGGIFNSEPDDGDVVRKLLPVSAKERSEVLLWTGEKIGVMGFRKRPRWDFDAEGAGEGEEMFSMEPDDVGSGGQSDPGSSNGGLEEERSYGRMMQRALRTQADEVRWMRGLGLV
ncbi:hypothetical protein ACLMJK_008451 [Lecanora helva]